MLSAAQIGLLFVALSAVFFGLSVRDYFRAAGAKTPARRAWLRVGTVFCIIGIALYLINRSRG